MIFMKDVVAVNRVFAIEISESHKDLNLLIGSEAQHVLLRLLGNGRCFSIPIENSKLFHMNVNWVSPI
jgi:hypothetical protein